jgi:23S rRNA (guanosine2251-2'-O)-methyltransferase
MNATFLWGYHPVCEALRARRREIKILFMVQEKMGPRDDALLELARSHGIPVEHRTPEQLATLVGHRRHQGIAARVAAYPASTLEEIMGAAGNQGHDPFVLVLDQVVDPQNLGAIVRSAQCAGIHGVVLPKDRSAPPSAAASKASAGALEHMRLAYVTNLSETLKRLKDMGLWIAGADHRGRKTVFESDLTGALAVVIGGEEKGIRPLVKKHCDFMVAVPQAGPIGSLNASAAAAVIIYEAYRQRQGTKISTSAKTEFEGGRTS